MAETAREAGKKAVAFSEQALEWWKQDPLSDDNSGDEENGSSGGYLDDLFDWGADDKEPSPSE